MPHAPRPTLHRSPPPTEGQVLVLLAHPALHRSRVNRRLAEAIADLDGVTVHDLYEAYPDLDIDVRAEQARVLAHRVLVWQHPFFWYSTPAILKEWQDLVLEFGWAYGPGGTALRGKPFLQALTTGGPEASYTEGGYNQFTMRQLLAPIEQTAKLCGMDRLTPFIAHGTVNATDETLNTWAAHYRSLILSLRDAATEVS